MFYRPRLLHVLYFYGFKPGFQPVVTHMSHATQGLMAKFVVKKNRLPYTTHVS